MAEANDIVPVEESTTGRFAAYDTRTQRFVGGVHDTKGDARQVAKDKGVKASDIEIREV